MPFSNEIPNSTLWPSILLFLNGRPLAIANNSLLIGDYVTEITGFWMGRCQPCRANG